jgi:hypothetical protein
MKKCSKCGQEKPETDFYRKKRNKDGLLGHCKACENERVRSRYTTNLAVRQQKLEEGRRWRSNNPGRDRTNKRSRYIRAAYGLTIEQHKQVYLDQNGCCAMCKQPVEYSKVQTDHSHVTGKFRGLLCYRCNSQIAIFDNYDLWDMALDYIEKER